MQVFVFALQALCSPAPMSFPHAGTSSEVTHPGASPSSPSLASEGHNEGGGDLGMPLCCFLRVFLSSHLTFVQREGWRSLWSLVRCTRARLCLLVSFVGWGPRSCFFAAESCFPLCLGWLSLLISARPVGGWGGKVFGGSLYSRLHLLPHLCTPCEVMRRESLRSPAPIRVPPRLPDLRLGKPGRSVEPAVGRMTLVTGLVTHAVSPYSVHCE